MLHVTTLIILDYTGKVLQDLKKKETNNNTEQNTVQKITGHGKPKIYRYL